MMKGYCDMVTLQMNGEDFFAVIGGRGPSSYNSPEQPGTQYSGEVYFSGFQRCNEIHFYKVSTGQSTYSLY